MKIFNTAQPYPDTFLFLLAIMIVCKDQNYITLRTNIQYFKLSGWISNTDFISLTYHRFIIVLLAYTSIPTFSSLAY